MSERTLRYKLQQYRLEDNGRQELPGGLRKKE
jgi:hypothetical protein